MEGGAVGHDPRRIADAAMLVRLPPGTAHAQLLGDLEAGRQRVLVKAIAAIAAAEEGVASALDGVQAALGADRADVIHWMFEGEALHRVAGRARRVHRYEQGRIVD